MAVLRAIRTSAGGTNDDDASACDIHRRVYHKPKGDNQEKFYSVIK